MNRDGTRLVLEIPASGPLFEGHFPGRPILPAVGLLDLALRALAVAGAHPGLRGIESLRLRRIVLPGDRLELHVQTSAPDGRARLEMRRGDEVVARTVVLLGEPSPGIEGSPTTRVLRTTAGVPPLDDLLPQRPPMRLVEAVGSETADGLMCAVRLPGGSAFATDGSAPALVALEMAAQTAAVSEALRRTHAGGEAGARVGYLVGARDVTLTRARVPAGERLLASVRLTGIALPLCTYTFEVARGGVVVASGSLSTWLTATDA